MPEIKPYYEHRGFILPFSKVLYLCESHPNGNARLRIYVADMDLDDPITCDGADTKRFKTEYKAYLDATHQPSFTVAECKDRECTKLIEDIEDIETKSRQPSGLVTRLTKAVLYLLKK